MIWVCFSHCFKVNHLIDLVSIGNRKWWAESCFRNCWFSIAHLYWELGLNPRAKNHSWARFESTKSMRMFVLIAQSQTITTNHNRLPRIVMVTDYLPARFSLQINNIAELVCGREGGPLYLVSRGKNQFLTHRELLLAPGFQNITPKHEAVLTNYCLFFWSMLRCTLIGDYRWAPIYINVHSCGN